MQAGAGQVLRFVGRFVDAATKHLVQHLVEHVEIERRETRRKGGEHKPCAALP